MGNLPRATVMRVYIGGPAARSNVTYNHVASRGPIRFIQDFIPAWQTAGIRAFVDPTVLVVRAYLYRLEGMAE